MNQPQIVWVTTLVALIFTLLVTVAHPMSTSKAKSAEQPISIVPPAKRMNNADNIQSSPLETKGTWQSNADEVETDEASQSNDLKLNEGGESSSRIGKSTEEDIRRDKREIEDQRRKRVMIVRHQVFKSKCIDVIPDSGRPEVIKRHALKLMASHMFPVCIAYECRNLLKLPSPICDSVVYQARELQKEAKKYKQRLHIKHLRQEAARLTISFW